VRGFVTGWKGWEEGMLSMTNLVLGAASCDDEQLFSAGVGKEEMQLWRALWSLRK
jgi:hypothetical protein